MASQTKVEVNRKRRGYDTSSMQIYSTWAWFPKALHVLKHMQHVCWRHLQKNVQLHPLRIEVGKTVSENIYSRLEILEYAVSLYVLWLRLNMYMLKGQMQITVGTLAAVRRPTHRNNQL